MEQREALLKVLKDYAVPDPKIVGKLPKGGITLDFVGHADITRILIEVDPLWSWSPVAWDEQTGMPKVHVANGVATMWGTLTVCGKTLLGVATCQANKPDLYKELASDFLRNAAMRFGISLSLWSKAEWEDLGAAPAPAPVRKVKAVTETTVIENRPVDKETINKFLSACMKANLDHDKVADHAGVNLAGEVTAADLTKLRNSFNELKGTK
jgi:hypothetical protein